MPRNKRSTLSNDAAQLHFIFDAAMVVNKLLADNGGDDLNTFPHALGNKTYELYSGRIKTDATNEVLFDFVLTELDTGRWDTTKVLQITQIDDGNWEIIGLTKVRMILLKDNMLLSVCDRIIFNGIKS